MPAKGGRGVLRFPRRVAPARSLRFLAGSRRRCGALEDRQEIILQSKTEGKAMQNIAEFRIIGRIGKVEVKEKVTYLSVASNYNRKDGDDWKTDKRERQDHRNYLQ
jgi:hypothetical protein